MIDIHKITQNFMLLLPSLKFPLTITTYSRNNPCLEIEIKIGSIFRLIRYIFTRTPFNYLGWLRCIYIFFSEPYSISMHNC